MKLGSLYRTTQVTLQVSRLKRKGCVKSPTFKVIWPKKYL